MLKSKHRLIHMLQLHERESLIVSKSESYDWSAYAHLRLLSAVSHAVIVVVKAAVAETCWQHRA